MLAGVIHTLGGVKSRPRITPAAISRGPCVPRTAQPPYSHVDNSTSAELDHLGLTSLREMTDVEPSSASDLGGDPLEDALPSLWSASLSEDCHPEDHKNTSGRRKRKKRKSQRQERLRSKEGKAISTLKIVLTLPEFRRRTSASSLRLLVGS